MNRATCKSSGETERSIVRSGNTALKVRLEPERMGGVDGERVSHLLSQRRAEQHILGWNVAFRAGTWYECLCLGAMLSTACLKGGRGWPVERAPLAKAEPEGIWEESELVEKALGGPRPSPRSGQAAWP